MESIKLRYSLLALAMTLVTTCVLGSDKQRKLHEAAIETASHRNEAEEHWAEQHKYYSRSESESGRSTRMRSRRKKSEVRSEWRNSETAEPSYRSR